MPLDKVIKFNNTRLPWIRFKDLPLSIKSFTIKSSEKIYYNILLNNHYLIHFRDIEEYFDSDDESNCISLYDNCISSEYDQIDGYYNHFKFDKEIYIESIELENLNPDFDEFPEIFFEYDDSDPEMDRKELEYQYYDWYSFNKKYFKFFNVPEDEEIKLLKVYDGSTLRISKSSNSRKIQRKVIPETEYKFKHLKNNTYYIEYEEEQFKKLDHMYIFNTCNFITSYYPII